MALEILSVEIIDTEDGGFRWAVRREKPSPVTYLFESCTSHSTRAQALEEFQQTSALVGWDNMTLEVSALVLELGCRGGDECEGHL